MTDDFGGRPFSFCHYLAVRSAWEKLKPERMVLHYVHLPSGPWWDLARPMLALHQLPTIEGIYGFPAHHPAHRADIVRLVALLVTGGVYLDTDVLVLRSFDSLGEPPLAAALEVTADGDLIGLSNAILVAEANSSFARLCLHGHDPQKSLWQGFRSRGRDALYVEMSVRYPAMLAGLCPGLLDVLPTASFLSTDWRPASLEALFNGDVAVPDEALALHLWESHAWEPHLRDLSPEWVRSNSSTFARLARPLLPDQPGRPLPTTLPELPDEQRQQMRELFHAVNSVAPCHRPSMRGRAVRRLKALVSRARQAWQMPLQGRIAALEAAQHVLLDQPPTALPCLVSWARCGRLDGSWALLQPHLPSGPFSALLLTGPHGEPSVCARLAVQPEVSCVWVSDSVHRADQLATWMQSQGVAGRAVHHPLEDSRLLQRLRNRLLLGDPWLVVIGPTDHAPVQLQALEATRSQPALLLLCVNPAQSHTGSLTLHPQLAARLPGPSLAMLQPGLDRLGYIAVAASPDGQFLLFRRELQASERPTGQVVTPVRFRSLYGDPVTL
jgi:hypothetical protein